MEGETQDQAIVWTSDLELKMIMIRKAKAQPKLNQKKEGKNNKKSSNRFSMLNIKGREISQ